MVGPIFGIFLICLGFLFSASWSVFQTSQTMNGKERLEYLTLNWTKHSAAGFVLTLMATIFTWNGIPDGCNFVMILFCIAWVACFIAALANYCD